jgi:hypothetical protein
MTDAMTSQNIDLSSWDTCITIRERCGSGRGPFSVNLRGKLKKTNRDLSTLGIHDKIWRFSATMFWHVAAIVGTKMFE